MATFSPSPFARRALLPALLSALLITACSGDDPQALLASGKDYLAKHDTSAALIQIKNALQKDANLPEARFLLGKTLLETGNPTGAEIELRKARELDYGADEVTPLLAQALLEAGQPQRVIDEFAHAQLDQATAQAALFTHVALAQASLGKQDEAQASLDAALHAQSDYGPALLAQARTKAMANDLPGALALVEQVLAKDAKDMHAWKFKGDLLLARGELDPAISAYRQALAVRSDQAVVHAALISLLARQGNSEEVKKQFSAMQKALPKHPQTHYMQAMLAYEARDLDAARKAIQEVLKASPSHPLALQLSGEIEFHQQNYAQAESQLNQALQLAPGLPRARRVLAMTYLRSKQADKALSTLEPILDRIGNDATLLTLAGEIHLRLGEVQKAEDYFAQAVALKPDDVSKRTALAISHLAQASKSEAGAVIAELEQLAASDSGTTADLVLINALAAKGDHAQALKAIDSLEKKQPDDALAPYMRGRLMMAQKDLAAARKNFERALQHNPTYVPAALSLAQLDLADKQPDAARKRFEAVLAKDPKNVQALLALADLKAHAGGNSAEVSALIDKAVAAKPTDPGARLALINFHGRNKDTKKALSAAQEANAAIPDQPALLDALGQAQFANGDHNQSLSTYTKLAELRPNSPLPHMRSAQIHAIDKNPAAARKSLQKALEAQPKFLEAQRNLILLALDDGKPDEARRIARDIQGQRPTEVVGYSLEGDILAWQKNFTEAARLYRQALSHAPVAEIAVKLHGSLLAAKDTAGASKFAAEWLRDHPKDATLRLSMADRDLASKDYNSARQQYQAVLKEQPGNALALNNLAWVAQRLNDPKALDYAEQAYKLAPNHPGILDTLAEILSAKGDSGRALTLQQQAVALAPQAANLRLNLARILIKNGDKAAARKELESLQKLGNNFPGQAEVGTLMKSL